MIKEAIVKIVNKEDLTYDEAYAVMNEIMSGETTPTQNAAFLAALSTKSARAETTDEIAGCAAAMRDHATKVDTGMELFEIVGTGGDGKNTFNISTCSCFVVAGAGYNVVKHGNYGATSVSGASNVMEQHGVKFTNDIDKLRTSMDTCHIAYLHAPLFNPALKAVAPVRKSLGVRSFFNMLGPLVNPVMPTYQLLGVYNLPLLRLYNYTYQESCTRFAVVHSLDGYDEISLTADFKVAMPEKEKLYTPEMLGFKRCTEADLDGGETPEEAARIFDAVLGNRATEAQKSCVIANSAFAIQVICPEKKIETCIAEARESLESGKALATFRKFISLNQR